MVNLPPVRRNTSTLIRFPDWLRVIRVVIDRPLGVHLNLTDRCACHCEYCELSAGGSPREMPTDLVVSALAMAHELDCPVMLSGGEPLLHSQIERILDTACRLDVALLLTTGGWELRRLLAGDGRLPLPRRAQVLLSLDAAEPRRNDERRGRPGSHRAVLECVRLLRGRRSVSLVAVAQPGLGNVPGILALAARERISLWVQPCIYQSNFPGREPLTRKAAARTDLARLAREIERRLAVCRRAARELRVETNLEMLHWWAAGEYHKYNDNGKH